MTHAEIIAAWNAQADHMNQWTELSGQEKVEWAWKCALEEAAKVCDGKVQSATDWDSSYWDQASESCAFSIRAMKDKP